MHKQRAVIVVMLLSCPGASAWADCASGIADLNARTAHSVDRAKAKRVQGELGKAAMALPASETDCLNHLARAWRLWREEAAPEAPGQPVANPYAPPAPGMPQ
jgi:hypothetical protein